MLIKNHSNEQNFLISAYERVYRIRIFEKTCLALSKGEDRVIAGSVHLCAGQEAVPVGAISGLAPQDQVIATYRGHGWALECGVSYEKLLAEVCHKQEGVNHGRSGSALVTAPNERFLGENSIVGAGGPIACGAAMAAQIDGRDQVVVVTFGDGATSQGALHESLVFAAARKLPVIFVCENNQWSEMTPISQIIPFDRLAKRVNGYGIKGVTIDGTDPVAVRDTFSAVRDRVLLGEGPIFIECKVPRLWGHYNGDIQHYRNAQDKRDAESIDPLATMGMRLCNQGHSNEAELEMIRDRVDTEWGNIVERVKSMPDADPHTAEMHVIGSCFQTPVSVKFNEDDIGKKNTSKELLYINAVNEALRAELSSNEDVLVYGEDVGYAGGIFGATRDLQREFGETRVFDMPIAESAILGSAVGSALVGKRPIVEIMWADFLLVALDQIINQAANVRYLTSGRKTVPLVVRVQQGATPGSTAQHSQCLEALLCHIPGLKVGLPATAQDAYSMLRAAVADQDPTIIIESRALYRTKEMVVLGGDVEPAFGAALREAGDDVALVGWGSIMPSLCSAAKELQASGISAAVLDLRWLNPLDIDRLSDVVQGCGGRVVVAHEANITGGFGAEIIAKLMELHGPSKIFFKRVAAPDIRIPASPVLQEALLPNVQKIVEAANALTNEKSISNFEQELA